MRGEDFTRLPDQDTTARMRLENVENPTTRQRYGGQQMADKVGRSDPKFASRDEAHRMWFQSMKKDSLP